MHAEWCHRTTEQAVREYGFFPPEMSAVLLRQLSELSCVEFEAALFQALYPEVAETLQRQVQFHRYVVANQQWLPDLVVVGGHSSLNELVVPNLTTPVTLPEDTPLFSEKTWLLNRTYQDPAEVIVFLSHMLGLVSLLQHSPTAQGVFSGGKVRVNPDTGQPTEWSEAESYALVLKERVVPALLASGQLSEIECESILSRIILEPTARGSIDNIAHSMKLYQETLGTVPERVVFVTWGFKAEAGPLYADILHSRRGIPLTSEVSVFGVGDLSDPARRAAAAADNSDRLRMELLEPTQATEYFLNSRENPVHLYHVHQRGVVAAQAAD